MRFGCLFNAESKRDRSTQLASGCFVSILGGHWPLTGCNFEFLYHSANSTFFCCIALNDWDHLVFPRRSSLWAPSQLVAWDLPVWILYLVQSGFMIFFMFISEISKTDEKFNTKSQFSVINTCFNDYTKGLPMKVLKKWDFSDFHL